VYRYTLKRLDQPRVRRSGIEPTCKMASMIQMAPITPTSTQGNISQRMDASELRSDLLEGKKSLIHLVLAVLCRIAETIIHAAANENAAEVAAKCNATYLLNKTGFSFGRTGNETILKEKGTYPCDTKKAKKLYTGNNKAENGKEP
jgi:hypothetical protein